MMKYFILVSLFTLGSELYAQQEFVIGNKYKLYSEILHEERSLWIYLPEGYKTYNQQRYPVLYVLDGERQFQNAVATQDFFSRGMYASIPPMIVVGIVNTDRSRDLTPTHAPVTRVERKGLSFQTSGGASAFRTFLKSELMPFVNKEFRTSGYNILIGHSFGGLFALHTLLQEPDLFNAYVSIDPSLWWDNAKLVNEAEHTWPTQKNLNGKNLFIAMANNPPTLRDTSTNHPRAIRRLVKQVLPLHEGNLRWSWKYYEHEDHGTVVHSAIADGLRFVFDGLQLEVKDVPYSPTMVKEQYDKVITNIGFPLQIDSGLLNQLIEYCRSEGFTGSVEVLEKLKSE